MDQLSKTAAARATVIGLAVGALRDQLGFDGAAGHRKHRVDRRRRADAQ